MKYCRECGRQVQEGISVCEVCGADLSQVSDYHGGHYPMPPAQQPKKDKDVMIIIVVVVIVVIALAAAFAYFMIVVNSGFNNVYYSTPAGAWMEMSATSPTEGRMTFGAFTSYVQTVDIEIHVNVDGASSGVLRIPHSSSTTVLMDWIGGPTGASALYTDYSYQGGGVNSGDYITLTGLEPDTTYTFTVFHVPTDSTVVMTGASPMITTPASY
jgi:hypothetical protein